MPPLLQVEDIQGLVLYGYGRLRSACFLVLHIVDPSRCREWLRTLDVRSGQFDRDRTDWCINIAFTHAGLARLGLTGVSITPFAGEFVEGMSATQHRRRILGDVGESAPDRWAWGGPGTSEPHVLLLLYGRDPSVMASVLEDQRPRFSSGLETIATLDSNWLPFEKEHFGFRDGISQVGIEGFHSGVPSYNTVAAGEFVLGYRNAYGQYAERPLVAPDHDPRGLLPVAPDDPRQHDFGLNGSYLVFRQLSQNVKAFWSCIDGQVGRHGRTVDPADRIKLAAKMVGRWPGGAPLVKSADVDDPALSTDNDFLYCQSGDRQGFRCPIGSHIRRANPRDALEPDPGSDRSINVGKRHRILRRGRPYGAPVSESMSIPDMIAAADVSGERGMHFICFNAHIGRQFEFIQHTWIDNPKFDGLYEDDDPLAGSRGGGMGGAFTIQDPQVRTRVTGLPRFVQVRGGGYFFMPGIRAIRFLATLG